MGEGNIFSLFTLAGGGVPRPRFVGRGVPHPRSGWGVPFPFLGGGTPSQVGGGGGVPHPRSGWCLGYHPPARFGWWVVPPPPQPGLNGGEVPRVPPSQVWMVGGYPGCSPARSGWWGYPPPARSDGLFTLSVSRTLGPGPEKMSCMKLYRMFHITLGPGHHCFLLCWSLFQSRFLSRSKPV